MFEQEAGFAFIQAEDGGEELGHAVLLAIGGLASIKKGDVAVVVLEGRDMGNEIIIGGDGDRGLLEDLVIGMRSVPVGVALLALDEVYLAEERLDLSHRAKIKGSILRTSMAKKISLLESGGLKRGDLSTAEGLGSRGLAAEGLRPKGLTGRLLVKIDPRAELGSVLKGLKGVVLERLRVAVIEEVSAAEVRKMATMKGSPFVAVEAERMIRKLAAKDGGALPFVDSRVASWGIQAVNVGIRGRE